MYICKKKPLYNCKIIWCMTKFQIFQKAQNAHKPQTALDKKKRTKLINQVLKISCARRFFLVHFLYQILFRGAIFMDADPRSSQHLR